MPPRRRSRPAAPGGLGVEVPTMVTRTEVSGVDVEGSGSNIVEELPVYDPEELPRSAEEEEMGADVSSAMYQLPSDVDEARFGPAGIIYICRSDGNAKGELFYG